MKGVNWGRILLRLLLFLVVMNSLTVMANFLGLYFINGKSLLGLESYLTSSLARAMLYIPAAGLFWLLSGRFMPIRKDGGDETWDSRSFATFAVTTIGAYSFFQEGAATVYKTIPNGFSDLDWFLGRTLPRSGLHLVTTSLAVLIVTKSKSLASWIAK